MAPRGKPEVRYPKGGFVKSLFIALILLVSTIAWSSQSNLMGFVQVNGKKLYVDYTPAPAGKPTIVFVNGLTYSTRNWFKTAQYVKSYGFGVLLFDMAGMGATLLSNPLPKGPILYLQQAVDLKTLLKTLKVKGPYNLVGLSYGGGILAAYATKYPRDIASLVMIAPYTEFLETQKNFIKAQISWTRKMYPHNPASDEELTDFFIRQLVYTTYPLAEISSVENPYKLEGITRIVQGIRTYQPIDEVNNLPTKSLHLVLAERDQYIPKDVFEKYWKAAPARARASRTIVKYSEHKLPDVFPRFVAQFIKGVAERQPLLFQGDTLSADPITMKIQKVK